MLFRPCLASCGDIKKATLVSPQKSNIYIVNNQAYTKTCIQKLGGIYQKKLHSAEFYF